MTRFERGMHRIGVVVSVPLLAAAGAILMAAAFWLFQSFGADAGCDPYAGFSSPTHTPSPQACVSAAVSSWRHAEDLGGMAVVVAACAVAWYVLIRAIAWVIAGFMGPLPSADPHDRRGPD